MVSKFGRFLLLAVCGDFKVPCKSLEEVALCCSSPAHSVWTSHSFFQLVIKRPMISALIPELFTADSLQKNLSRWTVKRWRVASNSSSLADFCSCKIARAESISLLICYNSAKVFCQHIRYYVILLTIYDVTTKVVLYVKVEQQAVYILANDQYGRSVV